MLKGLKRLSSEERLRATTVQSREKALRGLVNVYEQLMEGNEELSHTLLSGAFQKGERQQVQTETQEILFKDGKKSTSLLLMDDGTPVHFVQKQLLKDILEKQHD